MQLGGDQLVGDLATGQPLRRVVEDPLEQRRVLTLCDHWIDAAQHLGFIKNTPFLTILNTDGRNYIKNTKKRYDAIIIDLPDPDTFQINRFFTSEFFNLSRRILSEGGILSFGLKYSPNYISEIRKKKLSTIYNSARAHFENVIVLPGGKAYFLCRDGTLHMDIPERLKMKSINTTYVEGFYYCTQACFLAKQTISTQKAEDKKSAEHALNQLSLYRERMIQRLKNTKYPHYVYWLFDDERLEALIDDINERIH